MSGIAGIVRFDGAPVDTNDLLVMANALAGRGPDGQNTWSQVSVGLVHTALYSTPESLTEQQPTSLGRRIWITADARIDNRDELRQLLVTKGSITTPLASDVDYILRAYDIWKHDCVKYLIGDFAFVIWDMDGNTFFCARDHFGVRPFYYYYDWQSFVFGSEAGAILALPQHKFSPHEPRIADYLVQELEGIDVTSTFYNGIYRLPPGHTMLIRDGIVSFNRYWTMEAPPAIRYRRNEEYIEAFLEKFSQAVQCRLRAPLASQVACMLSGGLDSSSITGIARDCYRQQGLGNFKVLSAVAHAEDTADIESHFVNAVVAQGYLDPSSVSPKEIENFRGELSYYFDHITDLYDHWMQIPQLLFILAGRNNIKTVLTGIGGDEFAGLPLSYPSYLLRTGQIWQAVREMRGLDEFYGPPSTPLASTILHYSYHAFVPAPVQGFRRRLLECRWYDHVVERTIINPAFAANINLFERLSRLWELLDNAKHSTILSERLAHVHHPYLVAGLERYDRVAAAYGVEARHPYTDKRLVEFLLAIPQEQLVHNGWQKILVRRAMRNILTDEVRFRRGYQHLSWKFQQALFRLEKDHFGALMHGEMSAIEPYIHLKKLRKTYTDYASSIQGDARNLWYSLTLAHWLNRV